MKQCVVSRLRRQAWPAGLLLLFLLGHAIANGETNPTRIDDFRGRPRLVVLTDMGNEPDDQMSMVRLLLYSNEIEIEGLVATTSTWQKTVTHPETIRTLIQAYGEVRPKLLLHKDGWPAANDLLALVSSGQPGYGMGAVGSGRTSEGAKAIIRAADRDDSRPLWVSIWGGANTLAQALVDVRASRSAEELARFVARLRVYSISDQDDAGAWIRREFPGLFYIVQPSTQDSLDYYQATWGGISGDRPTSNPGADVAIVTNDWLDRNIRSKGPLGQQYPKFLYIMEGDTPSFLGLIDNGLNAHRRPDWGGWGGRYTYRQPRGETHPFWTQGGDSVARKGSQDTVTGTDGRQYTSDQATVWRWRQAYQNDFAARMDWTVSDRSQANHNPELEVNGNRGTDPIVLDVAVGTPIHLDASRSSDPDGQPLRYTWVHYQEAGLMGTNAAQVSITGAGDERAAVTVTALCPDGIECSGPGTAHIILAVTDDGKPQLTSYRRIILNVRDMKAKKSEK